jgi:hypothetical protein
MVSLYAMALLQRRELMEHLAEISPRLGVQRPPPALRDENDLVFAVSCGVV